MKKLNKTLLKKLYLLQKAIEETEKNILPESDLIELDGNINFNKIRETFYDLYKEFDNHSYTLLEYIDSIVEDDYTIFEFDKLTDEEKKQLTDEEGNLYIYKDEQKKYTQCIKKFKNIDEIIDYIFKKE